MEVVRVLRSMGSVARTQDLLGRGVGARALARAVADGSILRLRPGVLGLPDAPEDFSAAVVAGGLLTCISAAAHYGLWTLEEPAAVHLSRINVGAGNAVNHRGRSVPTHPVLPMVGLVDVLVHTLQCRPQWESIPMVESALRRGDTIPQFVRDRLPGNRNGRARTALDRAGTSADSAIEVVARLLLEDAGWQVEPQVYLPGVGRVDFLVEGFLVIEIDGAAFHSDRRALRRDRKRNNSTVISGYLVLRFCYEDVMFFPDELLAQVAQVLGGRPVR
ncbi:very-short-patch-repair endonuclease [Arthrobacter sp. CAN_A6]|uniref:type IV toxin-antitoxin system AbiEi family antitoxin domain-containing protein n=1 Tax=Arthrobacter sp. CAN_A6 TaxID=2787721 RepID=UPI0018CA468A